MGERGRLGFGGEAASEKGSRWERNRVLRASFRPTYDSLLPLSPSLSSFPSAEQCRTNVQNSSGPILRSSEKTFFPPRSGSVNENSRLSMDCPAKRCVAGHARVIDERRAARFESFGVRSWSRVLDVRDTTVLLRHAIRHPPLPFLRHSTRQTVSRDFSPRWNLREETRFSVISQRLEAFRRSKFHGFANHSMIQK